MAEPELKIMPKKYVEESAVISARLPKDMLRKIDEVASKTGRSRNEILSICLEFALNHMNVEE